MQTLNFKDLFNQGFVKTNLLGAVNFTDIFIGLIITLLIAMFIFYIYRQTYSGVMYSYNYSVSLVLMAMITATIIMTISSNLVLSLGMVGALSIIRFRTPVKEPLDIVFMFWAIAVGITTGAKLYMIAVTGSVFVGIISYALLKYKNSNNVFLLIVHYDDSGKESLLKRLSQLDYTIKSKTVTDELTELTVELKIIGADTSFVEKIAETEGVKSASLVSYNGNFVG
ncbi:DUF4956 domain-containing protein [Phosphitispora sp. TUW77]|uniref:DUF4956 domain-containing protein n=1 Tax=Phosphitispora sp. TUW77 TaxID=3152361 RepID=UPI003AB26655